MSWWKKATITEKLAQVDGAIEVGMTVGQCAFNVGTTRSKVVNFAAENGRHFSRGGKGTTRKVAARTPPVFDVAKAREADVFSDMRDEA